MEVLLLDCLNRLLPHQLQQVVLVVEVLRLDAVDLDQLWWLWVMEAGVERELAGHPLHSGIALRIKELFAICSCHI